MKKIIPAILVSLLVGFAAASWIESSQPPVDPGQAEPATVSAFDAQAPVEDRIRALEHAVMLEQQARQLLEEEILVLREEIEQQDVVEIEADPRSQAAVEARRESFRSRRFGGGSTQARVDRLVAAGFPPDRAQWIVDREAELQMEMLKARYEAMRGSEQQVFFGRGLSQDNELRAELGEADYERYLMANGRTTTVGIGRVLANSPAETAGIRPGDEIVRYDGERVFSMMDVAGRIMESDAEGNVVVDIVRDGVPMQLVLPRGPIGLMGN